MTVLLSYARIYASDMDIALPPIEALTGSAPQWRAGFADLELAGINGHLVLTGNPAALAPFRDTQATLVVDDLPAIEQLLAEHGAVITDGPFEAPNGRGLTARHNDGAVIEYVQWHDRMRHEAIDLAPVPHPGHLVTSTAPRVLVDDIDHAAPLLTAVTASAVTFRFHYQALELAGIGDLLVIAGTDEALAPYRSTHVSNTVPDVDAAAALVVERGGTILDGPAPVPTGRNLLAELPGGTRVEFVEITATPTM